VVNRKWLFLFPHFSSLYQIPFLINFTITFTKNREITTTKTPNGFRNAMEADRVEVM
jgi:hypothetical protein